MKTVILNRKKKNKEHKLTINKYRLDRSFQNTKAIGLLIGKVVKYMPLKMEFCEFLKTYCL